MTIRSLNPNPAWEPWNRFASCKLRMWAMQYQSGLSKFDKLGAGGKIALCVGTPSDS